MKKPVLIILSFLTGSLVMAQQEDGSLLEGSVIYQQVIQLDIQLEGDAAQFAHALPKERKSEKILHFTEAAALYENHHTEDHEEAMEMEGGAHVMINMQEPDNKTFIDLSSKKVIQQKEFMSRIFLIESEIDAGKWKLTGQQKTILDYSCQEAITDEDGKEVHAWFTPQISVPAGPGTYCNLPGLVLAIDIDEGKHILQATSVELKPVDKEMLKKPGKGKKVTEEEFQAIVDEKMKEMGVEGGGEGGGHATVVVKIRE